MNSRSSAAAQGLQAIQLSLLLACAHLLCDGEILAALRGFMLMLYLEKIVVWALKQTAIIVDTHYDDLSEADQLLKQIITRFGFSKRSAYYNQLAKIIKKNPSFITRKLNLYEETHREIFHEMKSQMIAFSTSIPTTFKQVGMGIYDHFTCTENSFYINAIAAGRFAPHQHFHTLTNEDGKKLIDVLILHHPYNLHMTFGTGVSFVLKLQLQNVLRKNDVKHAAWGCLTLQQGFLNETGIVATLPQEILNQIYSYVYPSPYSDSFERKQRNNFVRNVSGYHPGLFPRHSLSMSSMNKDHSADELLSPSFSAINN